MKRLKICCLAVACALLLCACGKGGDGEGPIIIEPEDIGTSIDGSSGNETDANTEPADIPDPVDDTLPPREGMVRSRLTNEWVDKEVANTRPIAVMTPNESSAVPHYNLSNASILYEANVEGRMTRLMAVYEDWEKLEKIGNVRSLRLYYAYWAFEWDAYLVHIGGPFFINELMAQSTTQDIEEISPAIFRSTDRKKPHNAYANGEGLLQVIKQKGYGLEYRGLADENHYQFATKAEPNTLEQYGSDAKAATYIDMSSCYPLTRSYFEYNEGDGLYYRSQHLSGTSDGPHVDAVTGEQLAFKNILVQNTKHEELGEGYLAFQCHDTTRDGWFFTNGKGIHVTWKKTTDYGATRYYDDDGKEITLNTGKTMVCIVEDGDTFSYK